MASLNASLASWEENKNNAQEGAFSFDPTGDVDTSPKRGPMTLDGNAHIEGCALEAPTEESALSTQLVPVESKVKQAISSEMKVFNWNELLMPTLSRMVQHILPQVD